MRKLEYLLGLLLLVSNLVYGQNCSQKLEEARRAYYNAGQLRQVKPILEGCLDQLSKEEQVEAYKLLTDSYLVLGETDQADEYLFELLRRNPTYKPRESDLMEFKNLFETYRIVSRYSFGATAGVMRPDYRIIRHQSASGVTEEPEDYEELIGYQLGITGEIALIYNFFINTAVLFDHRGFEQRETILDLQSVKSVERENRLGIPLQLKYIYPTRRYKPFISGGFSYHYLLSAKGDLEHFSLEPDFSGVLIGIPFSADDYDLTDLRRRSTYNWLVSAGFQAPLRGGFLLELKMTYERGFHNLIEEEKRFSDDVLVEDFAFIPDDFKVSGWVLTLSIMKNYTRPIKK